MKITEIKVGDKFTTKFDELCEIKEIIGEGQETRYLVYFPASDNWQIVYPHMMPKRWRDNSVPHVYGVGYARGTKENPATTDGGDDRSYKTWLSMLQRCYKDGSGIKSYKDVWVCDEWHNYMNFREWYFLHVKKDLQHNFAIDKDLLGGGKRIYSPQTCCFLPQEINSCIMAIKSFDNYTFTETSSKSVYVLSKLMGKYKDYLEERVVDVISNFIKRYSEEYKKVTKVALESHYRRYELSKTDLSKVSLTAFVEYNGTLIKFKNAGEMKKFITEIEEQQLFEQKSKLV